MDLRTHFNRMLMSDGGLEFGEMLRYCFDGVEAYFKDLMMILTKRVVVPHPVENILFCANVDHKTSTTFYH